MRNILLHIHLFKNAGTSVDQILQDNFPQRWRSREFPLRPGGNTDLVRQWLLDHPGAVAFSSHTILGPLPQIDGVRIIPIVLLRDPIERIVSAYQFERRQKIETYGATLAKKHGFAGYVHARLANEGDRQCRNFHCFRLAALAAKGGGAEFYRAKTGADLIARQGVLGLVSDFGGAMRDLSEMAKSWHPEFGWKPVFSNASKISADKSISPEMRQILLEANQDDLDLLRHVQKFTDQATRQSSAVHSAGMT